MRSTGQECVRPPARNPLRVMTLSLAAAVFALLSHDYGRVPHLALLSVR